MRGNHNPLTSATRGIGERNVMGNLSMHQMPVEWLDSGSWRLPSGKALAEFALQSGFLAPLLFRADFGRNGLSRSTLGGTHTAPENVGAVRSKEFGKGEGR